MPSDCATSWLSRPAMATSSSTSRSPLPSPASAAARAGQVGGDPVQPRPGTLAGQVITLALGKRDGEHLRRQIIGDPPPDPRRQILVNPAEIAPEDRLEPF